jgi:hypothetical protein
MAYFLSFRFSGNAWITTEFGTYYFITLLGKCTTKIYDCAACNTTFYYTKRPENGKRAAAGNAAALVARQKENAVNHITRSG